MTAEQLIKREILIQCNKEARGSKDAHLFMFTARALKTAEAIDKAWEAIWGDTDGIDWLQQHLDEFRSSYDEETDISPDFCRNYESKSVAKKLSDGTWVGFTYFYGGGKHSYPEDIPWLEDAYLLDCVEEEKTVLVRTWKKRGAKK